MSEIQELSSENINQMICEQSQLMSFVSKILESTSENVTELLLDIEKACMKVSNQKEQEKNELILMQSLISEISKFVADELSAISGKIQISQHDVNQLRLENDALEAELKKSKKLLDETLEKQKKLQTESDLQKSYLCMMGSIMGTMIWKTSKNEETIELFIKENLEGFLIMANFTLNAYFSETSNNESYAKKYVMSIYGILSNVSAATSGRQFILESKNGLILVNSVLDHLKKIKIDGELMMRHMILMFIYNLTISRRGSLLIQETKNGVANIMNCFKPGNSVKIQTFALSVMNNLLEEFPTRQFYNLVKKLTSIEELETMLKLNDEFLTEQCKKFHSTLSKDS